MRVWLPDPIAEKLEAVANSTGLTKSGLSSRLLEAALDAVADGDGIRFPVSLALVRGPKAGKKSAGGGGGGGGGCPF